MYYKEHNPPHFHARSAGSTLEVRIDPIEVIGGWLSVSDRNKVLDWARLHQAELMENWKRAQRHEELLSIDPLN